MANVAELDDDLGVDDVLENEEEMTGKDVVGEMVEEVVHVSDHFDDDQLADESEEADIVEEVHIGGTGADEDGLEIADDDDDICIVEHEDVPIREAPCEEDEDSHDSDYKENEPEPAQEKLEESSVNMTEKNEEETKIMECEDEENEVNLCDTNESDDQRKKKDEGEDDGPKLVPVEETKIPDEETGFPRYMKTTVVRGRCIPINKKTWMDIGIDGNDAILDCASQVVPLMIKKASLFPPKLKKDDENDSAVGDEVVEEESPTGEGEKENGEGDEAKELDASEKKEKPRKATMLTIPDFYDSSIGTFLMSIGLSRVKQWYHKDAIKQVHKLIRKEGEAEDLVEEIKNQQQYYGQCKAANSIFNFKLKQCHMCEFKTESVIVMDGHLAIPHLTNRKEYKCNYCVFLTRDPRTIIFHFQNIHKKPCHIEIPPQLYECPMCHYESSQKQKAANHITKCLKLFNEDKVCHVPDPETEYPCITPKPITQEDIKVYEATLQALRPAALNPQAQLPNIPGLPRGLQQQMFVMQQQQLAQQQRNMRMKGFNKPGRIGSAATPYTSTNLAKSHAPQLYHMLQSGGNQQLLSQQQRMPTQTVNYHSQVVKGRVVPGTNSSTIMQKSHGIGKQNPLGKTNGKEMGVAKSGTFVICEICDGYIKDLEQLRTHMQWIHKVKIHPKMLASRPPLNCQKCQWRFFTDQGLERHLLGAHGLVTSNMQDMVDQNQDSGRCTICGRVFANKLVAHMNQVHKITLRPAHLSYKCTVCSATFNLYRLFENHVYMVHSGSVKRNSEEANLHSIKKQRHSGYDPKSANGTERGSDFSVTSTNTLSPCVLINRTTNDRITTETPCIGTSIGPQCKQQPCTREIMTVKGENQINVHSKPCYVKMCRIENCKNCLFKHSGLVIKRNELQLNLTDYH